MSQSTRAPSRRTEATWLGASLLSVYSVWAVAMFVETRRFFTGDSQVAYYGWMYEFGMALRDGRWPILNTLNLSSGNQVAEGQMGLYSPLSAVFALGSTVAPDLLVYMTFLKFLIATIGVVGGYALARSYAVRPPFAALVAASVSLCGFTMVSEAPRWIAGQMVAALLPWFWWLTKRAMRGANPFPALAAGYLIVSVGYVYGTIYLIWIALGLLAQAWFTGHRKRFWRGLTILLWCGLITVAVYLPGVLTAPVTTRHTLIGGDGPLKIGYFGFLALNQPVTTGPGPDAEMTLTYMSWLLPLLVLVRWRLAFARWRHWLALSVPIAIMSLWSIGPYNIGPLRWPGRILDVYTLVMVLTLAVLLERFGTRLTRGRLVALVVWLGAGALVRIVSEPGSAVTVLLLSAAMGVGLWLAARGSERPDRVRVTQIGLVGGVLIGCFQLVGYPYILTAQPWMPVERSAYQDYLAGGGVTLAVHDTEDMRPDDPVAFYSQDRAKYIPVGSLTWLTDQPVINSYSTIGFEPYSARFCVRFTGDYCPSALEKLLEREPETGMRWIDLIGVRTLLVGRTHRNHGVQPPPGWHETAGNPYRRTWIRDSAVPPPGSVVWSSSGVEVGGEERSDLSTSFTVTSVPPEGGSVVISRLPWPGYRIDGAEFGEPLQDIFIRVELTPDDVGDRVDVSFRPPGWPLEVACLWLAGIVIVGWTLGEWVRRRRRAL